MPTLLYTFRPLPVLLLTVVALGLSAGTAPAFAQGDRPKAQPPGEVRSGAVALSDDPLEVPTLGLNLRLPEGSEADTTRVTGGPTKVSIKGPKLAWLLQIYSSTSKDVTLTPVTVLDSIIKQRKAQEADGGGPGGVQLRMEAFDRVDNLVIGGLPASRAFLCLVNKVPGDTTFPVTGYTVVSLGAGQFVIFQFDCPRENFEVSRVAVETSIATASFRDPKAAMAENQIQVLAAQALLDQFNGDDLKSALNDVPVFYRIYRPRPGGASGDAEEVGYQRVQIRSGQLGELDADKPKSQWSVSDREVGYLVRVDGRMLFQSTVVDSQSIAFLSRDRSNEMWSMTNVIRKGTQKDATVQTFVRRGERITVKTTRTGGEPEVIDYTLPPKGYLSRVELYLLPRLVAAKELPGEFGFYHFYPRVGRLTLRRDVFEKTPAGGWIQRSVLAEGEEPIRTVLTAQGDIVRRDMVDDQVMEPIEQSRLRRIWADKKLPLE